MHLEFIRSLDGYQLARRRAAGLALLLATAIALVGTAAIIRAADEGASDGATATATATATAADAAAAEAERRLSDSVTYLASDELEGRGLGTAGIDKAAQYIADQFTELGLKTNVFESGPFQEFTVTTEAELGAAEENRLSLVGPAIEQGGEAVRYDLALGKDFSTLAIGGSGEFDLPVVFAGYGITAPDLEYDDYAGNEVTGRAVLLLRKEPQQGNPHSKFDGTRASGHALFTRKVANAFEHGAAAVILVNDQFGIDQRKSAAENGWRDAIDKLVEARAKLDALGDAMPEEVAKQRAEIGKLAESVQTLVKQIDGDLDELVDFTGAGSDSSHPRLPVFFVTRAAAERMVRQSLGKSLAEIESGIDEDLKPQSGALEGWSAVGQSSVVHKQAQAKNVVAVLVGEGPLAEETIIVGAHYDHLGYGGAGSLAPWTKEIHNGADDNASGTAALLEVARQLALREEKPRRRIVFMAFSGEERGLLGSAHYVREPRFPLESTVAMVNMDMVGRLSDNKLIVAGTGTATEFEPLVDRLNERYQFNITKQPGGFGPSDHASFYARQIPVMHIFTGTHSDYHRPSDDADKVNVEGMRRIADMVAEIVAAIDEADARPTYKSTGRQTANRDGDRPYFGSIPDFGQAGEGYALMGVAKDAPAERAGLKAGDVIVRFGESKIGSLDDFDSALRKYKAGDEVEVGFLRDGKEMTTTVKLDPPR